MKTHALVMVGIGLLLDGCGASNKQLHCRLVAVDAHYNILNKPKPGPWHYGQRDCLLGIDLLPELQATPGLRNDLGVEVRGSKEERKKLQEKLKQRQKREEVNPESIATLAAAIK